jgi:hypothetical protein
MAIEPESSEQKDATLAVGGEPSEPVPPEEPVTPKETPVPSPQEYPEPPGEIPPETPPDVPQLPGELPPAPPPEALPGILPLRALSGRDVVTELSNPRLERAIGVIYRPETELASHYFEAELPRQFDEYIWVDKTSAVTPLATGQMRGLPDTYPFGT